ncbi:hypothetical protein OUZ56_030749 [Daphnia magna]|uniref:Uncharacterized protein n=1 Tax=Daphnia magna TaxID=35525 RepID=A0ABQ9ZS72_9CRUS|nr:hypothetical protein OUZ56_030749 [Daphnia magna]
MDVWDPPPTFVAVSAKVLALYTRVEWGSLSIGPPFSPVYFFPPFGDIDRKNIIDGHVPHGLSSFGPFKFIFDLIRPHLHFWPETRLVFFLGQAFLFNFRKTMSAVVVVVAAPCNTHTQCLSKGSICCPGRNNNKVLCVAKRGLYTMEMMYE